MGGGISGHSLQAHGRIDQGLDPGIPVVHLLQLGRNLQSLLQSDMEGGRHQLCHHICFCKAEIQCPSHITDGTSSCHGAEGGNLCHTVGTVFTGNVFNDLRAAFLTKVRIKIRHTDSLGVQKTFEDQSVLHGIHFCDMHTVSNDGSRTGATTGSHRDAVFLGITDKVPDDQVVVHIAHPADDTDLVFQSLEVFLRPVGIPLQEPVHTQLTEIAFIGIALRNRKGRQMVFVKNKFQIAAVGDQGGVLNSLGAIGEQLQHFRFAFQIKLLGLEFHPLGIVHGFAGLDAQQNVLHMGILFPEVVGIVADDHRQSGFPGNTHDPLVHEPLLRDAVILKLQIEIPISEDLRQLQSMAFRCFKIFVHQASGHHTCQTGRGGNQTLAIFSKSS